METKRIDALDLKLDGPEGSFRARFASFNVIDRDGDVTLPGAFTNGQPVKIAAWGHDWRALPVGKGTLYTDAGHAYVRGQFFTDTGAGRDTYTTVKHLGELQEWSYGYNVVDSERGRHEGRPVRFLKRLEVFEVSPVLVGAGIGTMTEAIKGWAAASEEEQERLLLDFLRIEARSHGVQV
jgi:HK97 family phage prohead protease